MSDVFEKSPKSRMLMLFAAVCLVSAIGLYFWGVNNSGPKRGKVAKKPFKKRTVKKAPIIEKPSFPSNEIKKFLNRSCKPVENHDERIIRAIVDTESTFFSDYLQLMKDEDYEQLIQIYAQVIPVEKDVQLSVPIRGEGNEIDHGVDAATLVPSPKKMEGAEDNEEELVEPGKKPSFPRSTLYRNHVHSSNTKIEFAGISKTDLVNYNAKAAISTFPFEYRRVSFGFGHDFVGSNDEGTVLVLADGVSNSQRPELAPKAAVELTLEFFELNSGENPDLLNCAIGLANHISYFLKLIGLKSHTTLVVAHLQPSSTATGQELSILSIGDSCVAIVDPVKKEMLFETEVGQKSRNAPFQLSPTFAASDKNVFAYKMTVFTGSLLILYSDGVKDNIYPVSISNYTCAGKIAAAALQVARDKFTTNIPFNKDGETNNRGKPDDISIIVSHIQ